jgi:hypothetical protein
MDLPFKIVEVAPSADRIIATADDLMVARAAFDMACRYGQACRSSSGRGRVILDTQKG